MLSPIIDAKERKRQRDRERYASMSVEKRNEKNKKRREACQRNKRRPMMPGSSTDMDTDTQQLHTDQTAGAANIEASGDMATGSDCMAEDTGMSGLLGPLTSKVDFKLSSLKDAMAEYSELKHVLDGIVKEKEMLQHEKEMLRHQLKAHGEALAAMKEDILASKCTLVEARDALVALTDENSHLKCYLEFLKKKLQESESKNNQAEQQCGSAAEPIQPRGVQTRTMQKRKTPSKGPLDCDADGNKAQAGETVKQRRLSERLLGIDPGNFETMKEYPRQELVNNPPVGQTSCLLVSEDDIEEVRDEMIKGLLEIDTGRRKIGIKEMGKLNEKAFTAACLAKLPPEEVGDASYQLYSSWQQQLGDLSWYPFKTVTFGGNQRELLNTNDEKLQELERAWGSGARDAVVEALLEMKECGRLSDRSITYELWNYKEGRRATMREWVKYMSDQVKSLTLTKRREIRRSSGRE
ncbi:hypothetical protein BS78_08G099100 [Paspalum vaginatum]|nr:hypothetical protein BS78_08G099100 [Paspalum vaginatum]